jgi:hypothetical protein
MDTFGKRISPQAIQEIQLSAYRGRKLRSRHRDARDAIGLASFRSVLRRDHLVPSATVLDLDCPGMATAAEKALDGGPAQALRWRSSFTLLPERFAMTEDCGSITLTAQQVHHARIRRYAITVVPRWASSRTLYGEAGQPICGGRSMSTQTPRPKSRPGAHFDLHEIIHATYVGPRNVQNTKRQLLAYTGNTFDEVYKPLIDWIPVFPCYPGCLNIG